MLETRKILAGHVYRLRTGKTAKVLSIMGRGRNRAVEYRSAQQKPAVWRIRGFADACVQDITNQVGTKGVNHA